MSARADPRVSDPQAAAADPARSVFLTANAGSGKTETLIQRVARLLLAHAAPASILCVTYTKATAAEMQRRLFDKLGDWAVMDDPPLTAALAGFGAPTDDLRLARRLFARALETPGGLKIQTIHAFCEKLLRRFPLEAQISPGFTVLEDQAAAAISREARGRVALAALAGGDSRLGDAYAYFSVALSHRAFEAMFDDFERRRGAIAAYLESLPAGGLEDDVWRRCGFDRPADVDALRSPCLARAAQARWKRAAEELASGEMTSDRKLGEKLLELVEGNDFDAHRAVFLNQKGEPRTLGTRRLTQKLRDWLADEQRAVVQACETLAGATVARETLSALTLAMAYVELYEGAKSERGGLDFDDLIERSRVLLTRRADAAWVLYKLDGGIDHILLDEAQDTAPEQWGVLQAISAEFFTGLGARGGHRSAFAVADEKQSIFSFQGAAPERLREEALRLVGPGADSLRLLRSRRSRPEILRFVDAVFAHPAAAAGLALGVTPMAIEHAAARAPGGSVELWPPIAGEEPRDIDPWRPVDQGLTQSAHRKLATAIAHGIKEMVIGREAVGERAKDGEHPRPCRYGDFLILVRRRNALFEEILRALKREGVPVGGADRLKLSQHGLFEDLVALAKVALFPADDLSLAGVLRGPFCDLSEDDLFKLAYSRQGSLWRTLRSRAAEHDHWAAASELLRGLIAAARRFSPFDFYQDALARADADGRSMRQRILTRLGAEAREALDAFLSQALAAEDAGAWDLESFIARIGRIDLDVKREPGEGPGGGVREVRVMTVHGAKGLEAPIVFLPDTTTRATDQGGPLLADPQGGFLWAPRKADDCVASAAAREARQTRCDQESLRLLYVALTRTRDRLIVCGIVSPRLFERSWYDYVQRAFTASPAPPADIGEGRRRIGADPVAAPSEPDPGPPRCSPPDWTTLAAPDEGPLTLWRSPSKAVESAGPPAPSPLESVSGLGRWRRGDVIHRLLQILPDIDPAAHAATADRLLAAEADLTSAQRREIAGCALAVLADPVFAPVFAPGSRAEVAIAGGSPRLPPSLRVSGRMDRLVVEKGRVLVIDYKTNRPAPAAIEDCDPLYITQMAIYAAVLAEVFPDRPVEAALVWTDGPRLMAVPEKLMAEALANLALAS
ncbi:MAG TPA: double-strand break repair helicase AddA [Caulobacteraceae bacterium]|nr:double-strand break repair helicase AddA [Caulobacteraceae bacterium]